MKKLFEFMGWGDEVDELEDMDKYDDYLINNKENENII